MDNFSHPTQRKQLRLQAKHMASTMKSADESSLHLTEDVVPSDQLWDEWELEARQRTQSQDEWQSYMNAKALEVMRKIDPTTVHAIYGGNPTPMTPELYEKLFITTKNGRIINKPSDSENE